MNTTYALRDKRDIEEMKDYFLHCKKCHKSYLMFMISISSALRISDTLNLKIGDIWENGRVKEQIKVKEKKTKKTKVFAISPNLRKAIEYYMAKERKLGREILPENYLIYSRNGNNKPITRQRAVQIFDQAREYCNINIPLGTHGLRKTFTYHAIQSGVSLYHLMKILNHSSERQVLAYAGILQEELDEIYISVNL